MRKKSKKARPMGPAAKPLTTAELKKLAAGFQAAYEYGLFLQKRDAGDLDVKARDRNLWTE
jgi:hypothetical protein